jgi:hypothetical protein
LNIPASSCPTFDKWSEKNRDALPPSSGIHCIVRKSAFLMSIGLCLQVFSWLVFPSHHLHNDQDGDIRFHLKEVSRQGIQIYQETQFGEYNFNQVSRWEVQMPSQQSIKMGKYYLCWYHMRTPFNLKAFGGPSNEILQPRLRCHVPSG